MKTILSKEQDASLPKIFIAVPTGNGMIHAYLAQVLIKWQKSNKYDARFFPYIGLSPLDNARNTAVRDFLATEADYICFIDNDIIPPENTLDKLLNADKEIIAPLCPTIKRDDNGNMAPTVVAYRYSEDGEYKLHYGEGVEEVDFLTGGMHLIKREVMEKLDRPYYFTYHKNGIVEYSEDAIFSQQCQKLGYKLWCDYSCFCGHYKTFDIKDYHSVLIKATKNG